MLYLNERDIKEIGINWSETTEVIKDILLCMDKGDFAQPLKPYLKFRDLKNRFIAMPAFVGGDFDVAGIKWIAGFPDNIYKGMPRAHSMIFLNSTETGEPVATINTALISIIRTASVSGLVMKNYDKVRNLKDINIGILGRGPIGKHHMKMCLGLFGDKIKNIYSHSLRPVDKETLEISDKIIPVDTWEEAYKDADIFITCTVPTESYINLPPKKGSLHLNVSLRDYGTSIYEYAKDNIIVDSWENVCRSGTDLEKMHLEKGLKQENVKTLIDIVTKDCMKEYGENDVIMVNSMGMGSFDVATAAYYYKKASSMNLGKQLD